MEQKIYKQLLEIQKEIEPITKDATNPFFHSSYATLGAVIGSVKSILLKNSLFIAQPINDNRVYTIIYNSDGEQISDGGTPIICAKVNDPQAQGSAITYARRYGLMSILSLSAEDDDGESAMKREVKPTQQVPDVVRESVNKLEVYCEKCNTLMVEKSGVKDGKSWTGYFCPKSTVADKHPARFV
jgi:hypothetical protein